MGELNLIVDMTEKTLEKVGASEKQVSQYRMLVQKMNTPKKIVEVSKVFLKNFGVPYQVVMG